MRLKPLKIEENVPLAKHTTFKIGGKAAFFLTVKDREDLVSGINWARENKLPFFILGNGSNLLVSDKRFDGLVVKMFNTECKIFKNEIIAGAGVKLGNLLDLAVKNSLGGIEWMAGVPGTLGGAIYGNAGAFGKSMKNSVESVEVFDSKQNKIYQFKNKNCKFRYRESIFKNKKELVIISAKLKLEEKNKEDIKEKIQKNLFQKKEKQPLNFSSAGSIFKNPKDSGFSAGELLFKAALSGKKHGGAQISEKHANFIVNNGDAKAKDVVYLINLAKKTVKNKFGIKLEEEIQYLGKF